MKLKGLDIIINMLANSYYNRKTIIFDILSILTDRNQLKKIISGDLKGTYINQEKLLDKYFKILELSNIKINYLDEFEKIAPIIHGENYKAFLFTLFHQNNNEFQPEAFKKYQEKIIELYKQKTNDHQFDLEIAKYHFDLNFFCFEHLFEAFSKKFTNISNNDNLLIYSKLFKILTCLNFKETRSLNHFTNALYLSLFRVTQETLYDFEITFGIDFEAKIGFLLDRADKIKKSEENFALLIKKIKFCTENSLYFFDSDYYDQFIYDCCESQYIDELYDDIRWSGNMIKSYEISSYDLITSNFEKFLSIIQENWASYHKDRFIKLYESMVSQHSYQINDLKYLQKKYDNDAIFMLFIHYLYYFEIRDEKTRLKSLSEDENLGKNEEFDDDDNDDDEEEEEEEEEDKIIFHQIPIPEMPHLPIEKEELYQLPNRLVCFLDNLRDKKIFIWLTLYRLGDLIDDIISIESQKKLQNYIPVIKFLQSLGISMLEFHVFLHKLGDSEFCQFQRISHNLILIK